MEDQKKISQHIEFVRTYANDLFEYEDYKGQKEKLDSNLKNKTLQDIENKINILYEKTRSLEEIIKYSRTFLREKMITKKDEIRKMTVEISTSSDNLKNEDFIFENVDFSRDNRTEIRDRDGNVIERANISKGKIIVSGIELSEAEVSQYKREGELYTYKHNISEIIRGEKYRVIYMLDGIANNGVREIIKVILKNPTRINFLKIDESNCDIENIDFINYAGVTEQVYDVENEYVETKIIKEIHITLNSKNYEKQNYTFDRNRMRSNFWNLIQDRKYDFYKNLTTDYTESQIKQISGENQYYTDWDEHIAYINKYVAAKAAYEIELARYKQAKAAAEAAAAASAAARDAAEKALNDRTKEQLAKDRADDQNR